MIRLRDLELGQWVLVKGRVIVNYRGEKVGPHYVATREVREVKAELLPEHEWYKARVTGIARRYGGVRNPGTGYGEDYDPPIFIPSSAVDLVAVRRGMSNKEILVSPEHVDPCEPAEEYPRRYMEGWTPEERRQMSEMSKKWPRDKKGRWAPEM